MYCVFENYVLKNGYSMQKFLDSLQFIWQYSSIFISKKDGMPKKKQVDELKYRLLASSDRTSGACKQAGRESFRLKLRSP